MVYYDVEFANNLTGVGSFISGVNGLTDGLLGIFFLCLIFLGLTLIGMKRYDDFRLGFVIGSAGATLFAPLLWMAGVLPFWISILSFVLLIISILVSTIWKR